MTSAWAPDTYHVYGENLTKYNLCDTRSIMHYQRFFLSNNDLDPKIYQVTKIVDLAPQGVIKLSLKQDELDRDRDNLELHICNYYSHTGDVKVDPPSKEDGELLSCSIVHSWLTDDGQLIPYADPTNQLFIATTSYFQINVEGKDASTLKNPFDWRLNLINEDEGYSTEEILRYENLIKVEMLDHHVVALRPGRANSLIGKRFRLTATDPWREYATASIEVEVSPCKET